MLQRAAISDVLQYVWAVVQTVRNIFAVYMASRYTLKRYTWLLKMRAVSFCLFWIVLHAHSSRLAHYFQLQWSLLKNRRMAAMTRTNILKFMLKPAF